MAGTTAITLDRSGPVLRVTLARPEARNAMSLAMVAELTAALREAEQDGSTRVVVLRGSGGNFCAGADIKDMAAARGRLAEDPDAVVKVNASFGVLCDAYASSPLAIVAALEGTVMGGGFGLACVADVVIAAEDTVFRLPETSLGVLPAQIAPYLVERLGYSEARRLAVTGSRLDARQGQIQIGAEKGNKARGFTLDYGWYMNDKWNFGVRYARHDVLYANAGTAFWSDSDKRVIKQLTFAVSYNYSPATRITSNNAPSSTISAPG